MTGQTLMAALAATRPDQWRLTSPFGADIQEVDSSIRKTRADKDGLRNLLNVWIGRYQPCLFGKMAARLDLIHYCILDENDLQAGDLHVRDRIQAERAQWRTKAAQGGASGFVIALVSERLAWALPDATVAALARRLCELYLLESIGFETIYVDTVQLEVPKSDGGRRVLEYDVGVNYFSAHGDGRWWHDHRFPGGVALSMNSVGHLVRAAAMRGHFQRLDDALFPGESSYPPSSIDSLEKALILAMRTINAAHKTVSGKATLLCPREVPEGNEPVCPVSLPADLAGMSHVKYSGYYHTDQTLPLSYFTPSVERPTDTERQVLDFTYLYDNRLENPDYIRMGAGLRVRGARPEDGTAAAPVIRDPAVLSKRRKALPAASD